MQEWAQLMKGNCFISDLSANQIVEIDGEMTTLGRYAVWAPMRGGNGHQIVEVGELLEPLMEKYHIPSTRVCKLDGVEDT